MEQLPGVDPEGYDPYARPDRVQASSGGSVTVVTDLPLAKIQTVYLGERACRQLEDLTWYFGSALSVIDRAISVFWRHTAIRKGQGPYDQSRPWPTTAEEAWDRIYEEATLPGTDDEDRE